MPKTLENPFTFQYKSNRIDPQLNFQEATKKCSDVPSNMQLQFCKVLGMNHDLF